VDFLIHGHPATGAAPQEFWSSFWVSFGQTVVDAGVGFLIGFIVAVIAAVLMDSMASLKRSFMPLAVVLRSVPLAALIPLIVLLFGRGLFGVIIVVTLVTFFPTLVTVMQGLDSTPEGASNVVKATG